MEINASRDFATNRVNIKLHAVIVYKPDRGYSKKLVTEKWKYRELGPRRTNHAESEELLE
jgi:hypothetical protein